MMKERKEEKVKERSEGGKPRREKGRREREIGTNSEIDK